MADDPSKIAPRTLFLNARQRAERKFYKVINKLLLDMERKLKAFKPRTIADVLRFIKRFTSTKLFHQACEEAANQTVTMLAVGQKSSWREAAFASSRGREIYEALQQELSTPFMQQKIDEIIQENAKLIKTVPEDIAARISNMAKENWTQGLRPDEIVDEIMKKAPELRRFEARRLARTESAKASTALIQARSEMFNRPYYIWRTCKDERTRDSHRIMEGVVCLWSDPPNPEAMAGEKSYGSYHPGGIFNCRCIPEPIVSVDRMTFPCKVCVGGSIITVRSLDAFKKRFEAA